MNTKHVKSYAPKARKDFMAAVIKRLQLFGITATKSANKQGELQIQDATVQGSVLEIGAQHFDAKLAAPRKRLVERAQTLGFYELVEHVAYTWFNRLCAIRYMELHNYFSHGFRVLSHPTSADRIELIEHAADVADELGLDKEAIVELKLAGDQDETLYRELLLGQCHQLHLAMPFLFEALDDETELLLPDNLTRTDSVLKGLVNEIPEADWDNVEIIGWLYQFYISEKKDSVIGKVVKSEDIPAATQLFTPNWIVQYLVQNSLGRHWLQSYPNSPIKAAMPYYIEPGEQPKEVEEQLQAITSVSLEPESIKVLDPACGSGHILVEAYKVLKAIYEERGYRGRDIPQLILKHNLFGLDIDDRAGQLAGFTLMMLAREDDRRFFRRVENGDVTLNVVSLKESQHLNVDKLWRALNLNADWKTGSSQGLFEDEQSDLSSDTADNRYTLLKETLTRFNEAKTFGSLIEVPAEDEKALAELLNDIERLEKAGDTMQRDAAKVLQPYIKQAWILAQRYDAVIANPPYMGSKYHVPQVKKYLKDNYKGYEKDLFSAFIVRNLKLAKAGGQLGFMTPFVWMFISSYEELRRFLIEEKTITSLIQLEYSGFEGATVPICTFTLENEHHPHFKGGYVRLSDFKGAAQQGPKALEIINAANQAGK
jgi:SAM-dependent methyltransferase